MTRLRAIYGAGPLNLIVLVVSFVIAGLAVMGWFQRPRDVETIFLWFAAAVVLHDFVLLPFYSLVDRVLFRWLRRRRPARGARVLGVVNSTPYLRIPAILSGLMLLVFFPVIFGLGAQTELSASGIAESGYLARWLVASGVIFALSGVAWVVVGRSRPAAGRVARASERTGPGDDATASPAPDPVAPSGDAAPAPPDDATPNNDAALPPGPD